MRLRLFFFGPGDAAKRIQEVVFAAHLSRGTVFPTFLNSNRDIMESVYVNVFMFAMVNSCFVRSSYVNESILYPILEIGSYNGT